MRLTKRMYFTALTMLACSVAIFAQDALTLQENSVISIDGTSSLHAWTMTIEEGRAEGEAEFTMDGSAITGLHTLSIHLEAEGLKSGKPPLDANAYKALNTTEYPAIVFTMKELKNIATEEAGSQVEVLGDLSIAGSSKEVTLAASCAAMGGAVTCTGSIPILMTDFGIEPPSVMLGTIKAGDEVVINYEAVFGN